MLPFACCSSGSVSVPNKDVVRGLRYMEKAALALGLDAGTCETIRTKIDSLLRFVHSSFICGDSHTAACPLERTKGNEFCDACFGTPKCVVFVVCMYKYSCVCVCIEGAHIPCCDCTGQRSRSSPVILTAPPCRNSRVLCERQRLSMRLKSVASLSL